jgi:hypothetical protein
VDAHAAGDEEADEGRLVAARRLADDERVRERVAAPCGKGGEARFVVGELRALRRLRAERGLERAAADVDADAEYHVHGFDLAFDCVRALDPSYPSSGEEQRAGPTMTTVVKDHIAIGPRPSQTYQIANTQLRAKRSNPGERRAPYDLWIATSLRSSR